MSLRPIAPSAASACGSRPKYVNLTRRFFAEHGIADYRIVESLGATEGAPASGAAELIVDITTTGATLEANALKILDDGTILRSQATLIASLTAPWGANARQAARDILARIAASEEARKSREVRARLPGPAHVVVETAAERFGAVSATGEDVDPHGFVALHCARDKVAELSGWLLTQGAERVSVAALEQTFAARNALYDALESRIGAGGHCRLLLVDGARQLSEQAVRCAECSPRARAYASVAASPDALSCVPGEGAEKRSRQPVSKSELKWSEKQEDADFDAAFKYLSLLCSDRKAHALVKSLRDSKLMEHAAKDMLRAAAASRCCPATSRT